MITVMIRMMIMMMKTKNALRDVMIEPIAGVQIRTESETES